jgi:SAM-dependent methyltransferase
MVKFNMGCGANKVAGWINVDAFAGCEPDEVVDLEQLPWPWADDCADEVAFIHSLEHLGGDPKLFLRLMQELYRICANGARVSIHVPHPRHDHFLGDPTHVRAITPALLSLFDRDQNDAWRASGASNTPLAHHLGVNFRIINAHTVVEAKHRAKFEAGEITSEQLQQMIRELNNIATEYRFELEVRKP